MLFSCYKVARIIAFVQCLQADIAPFIIHAENKEEYEGRLDSPARLEQLFSRASGSDCSIIFSNNRRLP